MTPAAAFKPLLPLTQGSAVGQRRPPDGRVPSFTIGPALEDRLVCRLWPLGVRQFPHRARVGNLDIVVKRPFLWPGPVVGQVVDGLLQGPATLAFVAPKVDAASLRDGGHRHL